MRKDREDAPKQGAEYRCKGVMQLRYIRYGKTNCLGGTCTRHITAPELTALLPNKKDSRGRIPLRVVLSVNPKRAAKLGRNLTKRSSALVQIYAINVPQATLFATISEHLPEGNPWSLGVGYHHPWLDDR